MKDIIAKYKKQKIISNVWIVFASLIIALSINFFILDSANMAKTLKTNILEAEESDNKSDIFLENNWGNISLKTSKTLNNIISLTVSLAYNPENTKINDILTQEWTISNISNVSGINSIIIDFSKPTSFNLWSEILMINTVKTNANSEQLNVINANFTDSSNETFMLTTSWITF